MLWRSGHDYEYCTLRTREDFILTGRNSNTGGKNVFGKQYTDTEFAVSDSEYADDTAIPFCNRADAEKYTPLLIEHFRRWGLEVHAGSYHPFKGSKTELLFCCRPLSTYQDPSTCDNTDMTDLHYKTNSRIIRRIIRFGLVVDYQPDYQVNYQPDYRPGSAEVPAGSSNGAAVRSSLAAGRDAQTI